MDKVIVMTIDNPVAIRLKEARKKKGLTQKELGIRIGVKESSASSRMNHYETSTHMPDFEMLKKLSVELEVPVMYFFTEDELTAQLLIHLSKSGNEKKEAILTLLSN